MVNEAVVNIQNKIKYSRYNNFEYRLSECKQKIRNDSKYVNSESKILFNL